MFKNKKIEKYMRENQEKSDEVKAYLDFFIRNSDEFEAILFYSKIHFPENGLKDYDRLSRYIAEEHKVTWKGGRNISPSLVRNFCKLARKEREARNLKRPPFSGPHTTFKVYEPDDDTNESH
jgi:hypothetical protein